MLSRVFGKLYARDGRPAIPAERLLRGQLLQALYTVPEQYFWTLDRTTITGRSAVILRQHTTLFRPMIVPLDDLGLVYQSLRTGAATNAQISARQFAGVQMGAHSTLARVRFFRSSRPPRGREREQDLRRHHQQLAPRLKAVSGLKRFSGSRRGQNRSPSLARLTLRSLLLRMDTSIEKARVHHAARRRGGRVAARCARARHKAH
jgi:hypothetical protein